MSDWGYLGKGISKAAETIGPMYISDMFQQRRDKILGLQARALQTESLTAAGDRQAALIDANKQAAELAHTRALGDKESGFVTDKDLVPVSKSELAKMTPDERKALKSSAAVSTAAEVAKEKRLHDQAKELKVIEQIGKSFVTPKEFSKALQAADKDGGATLGPYQDKYAEAKNLKEKREILRQYFEDNGLKVQGMEAPKTAVNPIIAAAKKLQSEDPARYKMYQQRAAAAKRIKDPEEQKAALDLLAVELLNPGKFKAERTAAPATVTPTPSAPAAPAAPVQGLYKPPLPIEKGFAQTSVLGSIGKAGKKIANVVRKEGFLNRPIKDY